MSEKARIKMSNIVKLGMIFDSSTAPDFGSICQSTSTEYILLAADISKLNSALTSTVCTPLLAAGTFNVQSGALAFVANWKTASAAKVYMYEKSSDTWYEVVENDG